MAVAIAEKDPVRLLALYATNDMHRMVEPGGVEPPSKQATPAAFSMLSPRLVFDQGLTVDGPPLT